MNWLTVDTQSDLDKLARETCWDDSEVLEFYASRKSQDWFPSDICYSGRAVAMNVYVLVRADSPKGDLLEIAYIDADSYSLNALGTAFIGGRIDTLMRVYIENFKGKTLITCARLAYRFLSNDQAGLDGQRY